MNLLCPNCQKMVTIADQFAGQLMQCPLCSGTFTAPVLPPATGAPPAVPLASSAASKQASAGEEVFSMSPVAHPPGSQTRGHSQPPEAGSVPEPTTHDSSPPPPPPTDYSHRYIIWVSPRAVPWIAPVALAIVFLLFFFPWRHVPADVPAEAGSQSGWGKLFSSPSWIFYFLIYLIALALAIGSLLLTLKIVPTPPQLAHLLPWKTCIVAGAVAFAFVFLYIGFWGEDLSTVWFCWTVCLHVLALIGLSVEYWLQRRGPDRPLPRIDIVW